MAIAMEAISNISVVLCYYRFSCGWSQIGDLSLWSLVQIGDALGSMPLRDLSGLLGFTFYDAL